jgi:hypothetical protein
MSARAIVICLDGADGRMLDHYSVDGSLPNLAALRRAGAARSLSAPLGSTDDALWASFQYKLPVGEHGRYHYETPQEGNRLGMAHERERLPAFWDDLSSSGLQVAVLDVPKCRAPGSLNGIHIVDWLTHGEYFSHPRSFPVPLIGDVLRRFGARPHHECGYFQFEIDNKDPENIAAKMTTEVSMKLAAGLHYLESMAWDLFCIGFSQLHCINHKFWDFDELPAFEELRTQQRPIFEILNAIDAAIGALVSSAGPAAECIVLAPTDFERNGSLEHLMPQVIARINAALFDKLGAQQSLKWSWNLRLHSKLIGHDPTTWPCTMLPYNENFLALRISARGERTRFRGASSALPDDELIDAVESEFLGLRDDADGTTLKFATSRPSRGSGRCAHNLPDLLIHYPSGHFPNAVRSPGIGRVEVQSPMWRKGNHRDGGFVFACGPMTRELIPSVRLVSEIGSVVQRVLTSPPQSVGHGLPQLAAAGKAGSLPTSRGSC